MTRTIPILMALAMSFSLTAAMAQKSGGTLSATDTKFVMEAAQGGMAEVKLGQLALKQASNTDVKSFGQHMVEDHGKANDELKALAQQKNVTLPKDVKPADEALYNRLSKLNGAAFDKLYMSEMVKDHKKDVAAFKHASTASKDADLKAWAGKTLPVLEDHLKMAEQRSAEVGKGGGKK